ncbi:orotidine-5'-phosphate decarboxylase [Kiloniella sp. b19]|uniref:orotidine-5'-phosphate decarboxylase n=1 Tax=Kiloniella sp. GXU_MW_B19 TaxID=3141326 RepID=UPI0031D33FF0
MTASPNLPVINEAKDRILVALDTRDVAHARTLAQELDGLVGGLKVGKEFFTAVGPQGVQKAVGSIPLFADLKFHDIPNTVAGAVRSAVQMSPMIVNVHATGGRAMMEGAAQAATEEAGKLGIARPLVIAVTVLTSMDNKDLSEIMGREITAEEQVRRLALLAQDSGMDGVVCSAHEITMLREACGPDFKLVVPGIRPEWAAAGDQKRIKTPAQAVRDGADYLVIGRPITGADNPADAARRIGAELKDL